LAFCGHGLTDANIGSSSCLFSELLRLKYRVVADFFYAALLLKGVRRIKHYQCLPRSAPESRTDAA
jgi:hypothetical protein